MISYDAHIEIEGITFDLDSIIDGNVALYTAAIECNADIVYLGEKWRNEEVLYDLGNTISHIGKYDECLDIWLHVSKTGKNDGCIMSIARAKKEVKQFLTDIDLI